MSATAAALDTKSGKEASEVKLDLENLMSFLEWLRVNNVRETITFGPAVSGKPSVAPLNRMFSADLSTDYADYDTLEKQYKDAINALEQGKGLLVFKNCQLNSMHLIQIFQLLEEESRKQHYDLLDLGGSQNFKESELRTYIITLLKTNGNVIKCLALPKALALDPEIQKQWHAVANGDSNRSLFYEDGSSLTFVPAPALLRAAEVLAKNKFEKNMSYIMSRQDNGDLDFQDCGLDDEQLKQIFETLKIAKGMPLVRLARGAGYEEYNEVVGPVIKLLNNLIKPRFGCLNLAGTQNYSEELLQKLVIELLQTMQKTNPTLIRSLRLPSNLAKNTTIKDLWNNITSGTNDQARTLDFDLNVKTGVMVFDKAAVAAATATLVPIASTPSVSPAASTATTSSAAVVPAADSSGTNDHKAKRARSNS